MVDFCVGEAVHFRITRHAFPVIPTRTASVGGEPSRPCDSPAPPKKDSSSSTVLQDFFKDTEQYKSLTFVAKFHTVLTTFANLLKNCHGESLSNFVMPADHLHRGHTASFL